MRVIVAPLLVMGCAASTPDPYLWLEEVEGERALSWVRERNAETKAALGGTASFDELMAQARSALDSPSRIPKLSVHGPHVYALLKDAEHPRGLLRRTTKEELRKEEPAWEPILDIDALSKKEGKQWVFKLMSCLPPDYERCLVDLSPGGTDAVEVRELDLKTLEFVEDGFYLPPAKLHIEWIDQDSVYVSTDFGPGSMTDSGYARRVKIWKRGTPLSEAEQIFEAPNDSVGAHAARYRTDAGDLHVVQEWHSYWESTFYLITKTGLRKLDLPRKAQMMGAFSGRLVMKIEGEIVLVKPTEEGVETEVLASPTDSEIIEGAGDTKQGIVVTTLQNVRGRVYRYEPGEEGWTRRAVPFPDNGALHVEPIDDLSGDFYVTYESFTTPPTLYYVPADTLEPVEIWRQQSTFDASNFEVAQHWATSADGTKVPYFMVSKKGLVLDGTNPTHIFSYGGFRVSLTPSYSGSYERLFGAYGKLWLERGGVFVSANIRGGGEFGPKWHDAALLKNRARAFEDFEAVAEDLIARKVTSPEHLGIEGRSNGGLLVTATMHRRPELYGAIVCGVPLADMRRYHQLLAGASWMGEFGNPDEPEDWAFISKYSPYQNLRGGLKYPPILIYTSTKDDRVHPGHARKMVARLMELGHDVTYYENLEGGHGGSSTNDQLAYRLALAYAHLWKHLK